MTLRDFIDQCAKANYPLDAQLYAFDGNEKKPMPVTGLLFDPPMFGVPAHLEFQTDEP